MKMDIFAVWEEQGDVKYPFVQKEKWLGKKGREARVSDGGLESGLRYEQRGSDAGDTRREDNAEANFLSAVPFRLCQ